MISFAAIFTKRDFAIYSGRDGSRVVGMKTNTNEVEVKIQNILGKSYTWDSELSELNYLGNPVSYWMTDYEAAAVKLATA